MLAERQTRNYRRLRLGRHHQLVSTRENDFREKNGVFYIAPTCIGIGKTIREIPFTIWIIKNKKQRLMLTPAILLGKRVFADSCNFFSPYYRQITMESWMNGERITSQRYPIALQDIEHAFDYYLKHYNQGRPFILAGHSQGAKSVIELLKHKLNAANYRQLVAAYPIGFFITKEELDHYPHLRPAKDSTDTGVIVCFNSVTDTNAIAPLFKDNKVCINPLNWKTDTTYANRVIEPGEPYFLTEREISNQIQPALRSAYRPGLSSTYCSRISIPIPISFPSIARIFPKGNLHVQELNLYFKNLRKNVIDRIHAYQKTPIL